MKFLLLILVLIVAWPYFTSGIQTDGSLLVYGGHDALWHLSLINEAATSWPLQFPGMFGARLANYHFLADWTWGTIVRLTGLTSFFVYFRIAPVISLLFTISGVYFLAKLLSSSRTTAFLSTVIVVFGSSAAYLIPYINNHATQTTASAFMFDHFWDQAVNIHTILGYGLVAWSLYFLFSFLGHGNIKPAIVSGILLGLLFSIKSFFFIPVALGLLFFGIVHKRSFIPLIIGLVIAGIGFTTILSQPGSALTFSPFWLSQQMIENSSRFPISDWVLRIAHYQEAGNILRVLQFQLLATLTSLVGGVWIMLLGFLAFKKDMPNKLIILGIVLFSLVLPFVIVPNPDHFNAIQFAQPAIMLLGILLGIWLSTKNVVWIVVVVGLLVPSTFINQEQRLSIPRNELEALRYLKDNTPAGSVVLAQPASHVYFMKVPAISSRRTFFSGEKVAQLIGIDYTDRLNTQNGILENLTSETLARHQISYALLEKPASTSALITVFENEDYIIVSP